MPELIVIDRSGEETSIPAKADFTVMEVIRDAGFDEMLALCGGCLSCATCHVFVDPDFAEQLPPMSQDESDLLDSSSHRNDQSRLSCQIVLTDQLSGLRVTLAPDD